MIAANPYSRLETMRLTGIRWLAAGSVARTGDAGCRSGRYGVASGQPHDVTAGAGAEVGGRIP